MLAGFVCLMISLLPATSPSTRSSVEDDLRRIIRTLQKQILDLKSENQTLKNDLTAKERQFRELADKIPKAADAASFLYIGMYRPELESTLGGKGEFVRNTAGTETYRWLVPNSKHVIKDFNSQSPSGFYDVICLIREDQLIAFEHHESGKSSTQPDK